MDAPQLTDIDFDAAMSFEQLKALDSSKQFNHSRRVMLLVLGKSKDELVATIGKIGADPFSAWLDQIERLQLELKQLLALSESARARLIVAGQVVAERSAQDRTSRH